MATAYGQHHSYSSCPVLDSSLPMSEAKQHESHQEHMNANNTLCGCDAVKTLQRILTFPAVSHILILATRLLISLSLQSQYHQNFLLSSLVQLQHSRSCSADTKGPVPRRLMLQGTGLQGFQLAGGAGTQSHLKITFRLKSNKIF